MSIAYCPTCDQTQERLKQIERERDQWRNHYEQERQAHAHTKHLLAQERQCQQQRRKLLKSPFKSTEKLVIEEAQRQIDSPHSHKDDQGFTRFCYTTAGLNIGTDDKTTKRSITAILEQCPNFPIETKEVKEPRPNGRGTIKRLYIKPTTQQSLIAAAASITELEHKREQGGNQYQCQKCLSHNVMIKHRLHCLDCGHETDLEPTFPNGKLKQAKAAETTKTNLSFVKSETPATDRTDTTQAKAAETTKTNLSLVSTNAPPPENFLSQDGQLVDMVIEPVTPPNADMLAEIPAESESEPDTKEIEEAAALLLAIAGDDQKHIEMSRTGEKKYYQVNRPLQLSDLVEHLKGGQARGALCSYRDGRTRALCFDADDPETWESLRRGARQLAQAGYSTILEESPAERGGHLWIIYTDLVNAADARAAVCELAPELEEITEYWPGSVSAATWNRVRLPGGFYARYGRYVEQPIKAWCTLLNAATGETASNGTSAATLLLASLTPAALVPVLPAIHDQAEQKPEYQAQEVQSQSDDQAREVAQQPEPESPTSATGRAVPLPHRDQTERDYRLPEVDARWIKDNGPVETTTLYFAITARYAARWFNEHHGLEEIRPRERNGLALSPNGNERTASTSYRETPEGERYTDHSQHGRRSDGTRDTGDALELTAKVQQVSKGQLISQTTREIQGQASTELESAARSGKAIPAWIEEIITPAGRRQYVKWLNAQGQGNQGEARRQTVTRPAQPEQKRAAVIVPAALAPACQVEQPEPAPQIDNQADQKPLLAEGQRVSTPAGIATISIVRYCDILHRWRCSVFTDKKQPDGSHYAIFDATEVGPMEQGTIF